MALKAA